MTVREDVAQVKKLVNSINSDVRLTNKFVYNKIIDVAKLIVRREADSRKIYKSTELFTTIECVELEQEELKNCTNIWIPDCTSVMKSVNKIPKMFLSSTGSIISVYSIDRSIQFLQTTPSIFATIQKREFKGNDKYFWIANDYLYIPNSDVVAVTIDGLVIDRRKTECEPFLSSESPIPDSLRTDVFRVVATEIGSITKRIPTDEKADLNTNSLN